jgi:thiol-disulfide isomerase/thioredoxin
MKFHKPKKKTILQIILIVFVIFSIRIYQQQGLLKDNAFLFSSFNLDNQVVAVNKEKAPILLHFWATWCVICKLEGNNAQNLSPDYTVVNIAMQSGTDKELIKYAKENHLNTALIINDNANSLAKKYGVKATPTSFIIDKNGKIAFTEVGYSSELGLRLRLWWASL